MREELCSKGYDIDLERRTPQKAKRLSEKDYKVLKESEKKLKELNDFEISLKNRKIQLEDEENQLHSAKGEFERFRALESKKLEAETQHSRQLEQQAEIKLKEAEEIYSKSKELHNQLMNMSDIFTEQYADDFARELGYTKENLKSTFRKT